jgi:quercetin dioxygenase-like cupin family protein
MLALRSLAFTSVLSTLFVLAGQPARADNSASSKPSPSEQTPAKPVSVQPETPLTSTIFEWNKMPVRKTSQGERREIASGPTPTLGQLRCHVTTLNPGTPWSNLDKHTDEEIVIIKEGSLEYEISGHRQIAGPGAVILLVAGDVHRSRNAGSTPVTYYVFHAVTAEAKAAADAAAAKASSAQP